MSKPTSGKITGVGCLNVLIVGAAICGLLFFNASFFELLINANEGFIQDQRIRQAAQFIVPVAFIFVEFWVYDRIIRIIRGK